MFVVTHFEHAFMESCLRDIFAPVSGTQILSTHLTRGRIYVLCWGSRRIPQGTGGAVKAYARNSHHQQLDAFIATSDGKTFIV